MIYTRELNKKGIQLYCVAMTHNIKHYAELCTVFPTWMIDAKPTII